MRHRELSVLRDSCRAVSALAELVAECPAPPAKSKPSPFDKILAVHCQPDAALVERLQSVAAALADWPGEISYRIDWELDVSDSHVTEIQRLLSEAASLAGSLQTVRRGRWAAAAEDRTAGECAAACR